MASNENDLGKLNEALKKAAEDKGKIFQKEQLPVITPLPENAEEQRISDKISFYDSGAVKKSAVSGISKKVIAYHNPASPITEQFRVVRTHICSSEKSCGIKTMAVTSSANGEGKTVVAVNLSVVMAQDLNKPVLLIDCNMRKPAISSLLGLSVNAGLGDVLSGRSQLKDVLIKTDIANLTVLPSGQISVNPNEILNSDKMKTILTELKPQFEEIILDTPAVIPYSEPRILSSLVDGVILVVRACKTRREVVARAEDVLKSVGANMLGYIITGIEYHIPEYIHRHL